MVKSISDLNTFKRLIVGVEPDASGMRGGGQPSIADYKLVVIDFTATWCGPCQRIAPYFEQLNNQYHSRCNFYKVDVDEGDDIAQFCQIAQMPTFKIYYQGKEVKSICGDIQELENSIVNIIQIIDKKIKSSHTSTSQVSNSSYYSTPSQSFDSSSSSFGAPLDWNNSQGLTNNPQNSNAYNIKNSFFDKDNC